MSECLDEDFYASKKTVFLTLKQRDIVIMSNLRNEYACVCVRERRREREIERKREKERERD